MEISWHRIQTLNPHNVMSDEFLWTFKGDLAITHVKKISHGGFGEVHMVYLKVARYSNGIDA